MGQSATLLPDPVPAAEAVVQCGTDPVANDAMVLSRVQVPVNPDLDLVAVGAHELVICL